jgi:hypothetical protein
MGSQQAVMFPELQLIKGVLHNVQVLGAAHRPAGQQMFTHGLVPPGQQKPFSVHWPSGQQPSPQTTPLLQNTTHSPSVTLQSSFGPQQTEPQGLVPKGQQVPLAQKVSAQQPAPQADWPGTHWPTASGVPVRSCRLGELVGVIVAVRQLGAVLTGAGETGCQTLPLVSQ